MTRDEAVALIHGAYRPGTKSGHQRIICLLELLDNPHRKLKFVHIAGTNGKGSTAAMLDHILRAAGYRTGRFVSPYLERFEERVTVDGQQIGERDLVDCLLQVQEAAGQLEPYPLTGLRYDLFHNAPEELFIESFLSFGFLQDVHQLPEALEHIPVFIPGFKLQAALPLEFRKPCGHVGVLLEEGFQGDHVPLPQPVQEEAFLLDGSDLLCDLQHGAVGAGFPLGELLQLRDSRGQHRVQVHPEPCRHLHERGVYPSFGYPPNGAGVLPFIVGAATPHDSALGCGAAYKGSAAVFADDLTG